MQKHLGFVEQDVTETAAENYSEQCATGNEIGDSLRRQIGISASRQITQQQVSTKKGENVGHPVPAWPDGPGYVKNEWVEMMDVIGEHGFE